jgi:hypothetical protein
MINNKKLYFKAMHKNKLKMILQVNKNNNRQNKIKYSKS